MLNIPSLAVHRSLLHGYSTKRASAAGGRFDGNMSYNVGDDVEAVRRERTEFLQSEGVRLSQVVCPRQAHTAAVALVTKVDCGRGAFSYEEGVPAVDGLITEDAGVCLMVMAADCTPIVFFDALRPAVGLVHAGRVGTMNGIVLRTVEAMVTAFGTNPKDLVVGIGPTICKDHYPILPEKAAEIAQTISGEALSADAAGTIHFDLPKAHVTSLVRAGVERVNIWSMEICTFENDRFFSERRDGRPTGRFATVAMVRPEAPNP